METNNTLNSTQKCVLIIDHSQPTGTIANISSVLSISLGKNVGEMVSHDVFDKDGGRHPGITQLPIPILGTTQPKIKEIRERLLSMNLADMVIVDFSTIAQQSRTYDEYESALLNTDEKDIEYVGLAVYGAKKVINKVTGNLSLIR